MKNCSSKNSIGNVVQKEKVEIKINSLIANFPHIVYYWDKN